MKTLPDSAPVARPAPQTKLGWLRRHSSDHRLKGLSVKEPLTLKVSQVSSLNDFFPFLKASEYFADDSPLFTEAASLCDIGDVNAHLLLCRMAKVT